LAGRLLAVLPRGLAVPAGGGGAVRGGVEQRTSGGRWRPRGEGRGRGRARQQASNGGGGGSRAGQRACGMRARARLRDASEGAAVRDGSWMRDASSFFLG